MGPEADVAGISESRFFQLRREPNQMMFLGRNNPLMDLIYVKPE
jgi:hypothetical protein